jgi:hypothetical protein
MHELSCCQLIVDHVGFCRPALHAALELGSQSFWEVIDSLLTGTEAAFEANLRRLVPAVSDLEVQRWGRSIRRALCAALLDKRISPDELRILVDGYVSRLQARSTP